MGGKNSTESKEKGGASPPMSPKTKDIRSKRLTGEGAADELTVIMNLPSSKAALGALLGTGLGDRSQASARDVGARIVDLASSEVASQKNERSNGAVGKGEVKSDEGV